MSTAEQALILAQQAEIQRLNTLLENSKHRLIIRCSDANELYIFGTKRIPFFSNLDPDDTYTVEVRDNVPAFVTFIHMQARFKENDLYQSIEIVKSDRFYLAINGGFLNDTPYAGETMRQMIDDLGNAMTEFVVRDKRDFTNMMRVFKDFIERAQTFIDSCNKRL